ncbi:MAG: hypothetical protein ABIS20_19010 [Thermoanaerobaculia bacterium]
MFFAFVLKYLDHRITDFDVAVILIDIFPAAVFQERWLALLAAAVLPGTGRDAAFRLQRSPARAASRSRPATAASRSAIRRSSTSAFQRRRAELVGRGGLGLHGRVYSLRS